MMQSSPSDATTASVTDEIEMNLSTQSSSRSGRGGEEMGHIRMGSVDTPDSGCGNNSFVTIRKDELEALIKKEVQRDREEIEALMDERIAAAAATKTGAPTTPKSTSTNNTMAYPTDIYAGDEGTKGDEAPLLCGKDTQKLADDAPEQFLQEEEHPGMLEPLDNHGDIDPEEDDGDDNMHTPFGESVYTLLYMERIRSQSFLYSIFIYGTQMATITLTLLDVIYRSLPPNVNITVTCAQAVTVFMLLAYMSDLIEAVLKLQDGHYPQLKKDHPGASFETWLISCLAQLTAGLLLLLTSFVLTMQSSTVLDLMLNLTALLFMSEIDDIGFAMAKMGFVTDRLQIQALRCIDIQVPKPKRRNMHRRILYFLALVGLFAGYGYIKWGQLSGYYLPTYIYVQFGDAYNKKIPYFSGILTSGDVVSFYRREYRDLGTDNILLGYCMEETSWTFSDVNDPCDYFAKSTETEEFIPSLILDSEWLVRDSIGRLQPFDSFSMVIRDCDPEFCQGTCKNKVCQCPHDRFGMDCEFSNVCPQLLTDSRFEPFPPATVEYDGGIRQFAVSDEFHLLMNNATGEYVRVYNMPVYYSDKTFPSKVVFFGGRRWIMTSEHDLIDFSRAWFSTYEEQGSYSHFFPEWTVDRLEDDNFHAYYNANYTPFFFSDPVDFETPLFQATPLGLRWWTVRKTNEIGREYEPDFVLETSLICKSCFAEHDGFCNSAGGTCNATTGLCECKNSYFGPKCEKQEACYEQPLPCNGEGVCDKTTGFCSCNKPWYGKLCYFSHVCVDEYGSCRNGGVCNAATSLCDCPNDPAIDGDACEKIADCRVNGCANGGYCGRDGKCLCRPPFHGILCDLVDTSQKELFCSENSDCLNGSCNITSGICTCFDRARYGTLCQHRYGCDWAGCLNGGTCNNATQICECPAPYFGPDCSQEPACVEDSYCRTYYGSTSICDTNTGTCRCYKGARSKRCFSSRWNCKHAGCNNRGTCLDSGRCECRYPYVGRQCEYLLEEYNTEGRQQYRDGLEVCMQEQGFPPYSEQYSLAGREQYRYNLEVCIEQKISNP